MTQALNLSRRPTIGGIVLQHLIVFLICVVFPGGVTWMAPATWVTFNRSEDIVSCTTRTCVYFVVPYRVQRLDHVESIEQHERTGGRKREKKLGRFTGKTIEVDGEGFLEIHGPQEQWIEVSVSPASLEAVAGKASDFLASADKKSTTLFAIANWKFGGLMGGILTALTALYVFGYTFGLVKWVFTRLKRSVVESH
jgi:hypothetical protein